MPISGPKQAKLYPTIVFFNHTWYQDIAGTLPKLSRTTPLPPPPPNPWGEVHGRELPGPGLELPAHPRCWYTRVAAPNHPVPSDKPLLAPLSLQLYREQAVP